MSINSEIYLIGLAVLSFLIIVFLFIRKIANNGKLKVKIEELPESFQENSEEDDNNNLPSDIEDKTDNVDQELAILNLISIDRSFFDIEQIFGFLSNYGAILKNKYFSLIDEDGNEIFRIANALNPGTFEKDTKTFAIVIASNLTNTTDPIKSVKQMIDFSVNFSEKFYANLCDEERTPITKQMISHMETRAQDIARIKQLGDKN
tara:strand:+ start:3931 stop:4545 length:615 start_codon:yes stop_codon:yes gene_type:complete